MLAEESEFQSKGSGWSLDLPVSLTLRVSLFVYNKKRIGTSYSPLPKRLHIRRATINIQNTDNECFRYSVLVKHLDNITCDSILNENDCTDILDGVYYFDGLSFPLAVSQISKFEKLNRGTSINIFEYGTNGEITPL